MFLSAIQQEKKEAWDIYFAQIAWNLLTIICMQHAYVSYVVYASNRIHDHSETREDV